MKFFRDWRDHWADQTTNEKAEIIAGLMLWSVIMMVGLCAAMGIVLLVIEIFARLSS